MLHHRQSKQVQGQTDHEPVSKRRRVDASALDGSRDSAPPVEAEGEDPFDLDIPASPSAEPQPEPFVKADPEEEEANAASLLAQPPLPQSPAPPQDEPNAAQAEDEEKPDVKPKLHVTYNGFSIFGRTLVVVYVRFLFSKGPLLLQLKACLGKRLEPYPPLTEDQVRASMASTAAPTPFSQRQLSATPLPASARPNTRRPSASASASSRPPVPLFRPSPTATPEPEEAAARDDGELERFRLRSQSLALDLDDDDDGLPPQIHSKAKRGISRVVEEEEDE